MVSACFVVIMMSSFPTFNILPGVSASTSFLARKSEDSASKPDMDVFVDATGRVYQRRNLSVGGDVGVTGGKWQLALQRGDSFNQGDVIIDDDNRLLLIPRAGVESGSNDEVEKADPGSLLRGRVL